MRSLTVAAALVLAVLGAPARGLAGEARGLSCATPTGEALPAPAPDLLSGHLRQGPSPAVLRPAKAYVLYFGAAWCGPCRLQVRAMKALYDAGDPARLGYEVVFVSKDTSAAAAADYAAAETMPWPYLPPGPSGSARTVAALAGDSVPDMIVIDARGRVLCRAYGPEGRYRGVSAVLAALRRALAGQG